MTTKHSVSRTRHTLSWLFTLVAVIALTSCGERNAVLDNYNSAEPVFLDQADTSANGLPSPTPTAPEAATPEPTATSLAASGPAIATEPTVVPDAPTASAPATSPPVTSGTDGEQSEPVRTNSINPTPLEGLGGELGCQDAAALRRRMSNSEVRDEARAMPLRIWLCTKTVAVTERLECFADETEALLAAMQDRMDEAAQTAAAQLRTSGAIFCADPFVIRLGMDGVLGDILDELDTTDAAG